MRDREDLAVVERRMNNMTHIDYELIDHGIKHAQHFQGCGVSFTRFDHIPTGCGSNFLGALDDALEMIAQDSGPVEMLEAQIREDEGYEGKDWPTSPNTDQYHEEDEESEVYYYVSVRYNVGKEASARGEPNGL